ncbi:MAG TPA: VWA domain-containing protein, partial [Thermoanaerobaculia bacterium]|nr:VWA domain-containing protein [Thermoanaerobaculia bacterium]
MARRDVRLALILSATLILDPFPLPAQEPVVPLVEVLDIRVTNVDVVVTGPDGRPADGLTAADFELYEDGKRQEITNFYEVGGAGPAAGTISIEGAEPVEVEGPRAPRRFIFYFDNGSLSIQNRNQIFPAVREFMEQNMSGADQAMIVTWNRKLEVDLPWTSDLKLVDATLEKMSGAMAGASQLQAEKRRVERMLDQLEAEAEDPSTLTSFTQLEAAARSYAENVRFDMSQSVNAISKILASLSGVDGRKVLVLATEQMPTTAGGEIFEKIESIRTRAMVSTTSTLRGGAQRGSRVTDVSKFNIISMIDQLANIANATGVTIYAINPKGTGRNDSGTADLQMTGDNSSVDFADSVQALDGVSVLARKTGGAAMVGAPASLALARIERDLGSYYSLGYRAAPGASPNRNIELRVKRPGHSIRARTSVYYRSLETEMADRVIANHLRADLSNELGVSLEADPVTSDGSRQLLPMRIVIPVDSLTLLPSGDGTFTGGFSVFVCSGDGAGDTSGVNVQSHRISWPDAQAVQMKGRRIGFAVQVPVEKGRHQVSVGVVDHLSQIQGFATMRIT